MQPVLVLYDARNRIVAMDSGETGLRYHVPDHAKDLEFRLLVADAPGTQFAPDKAPRHLRAPLYDLDVSIEPSTAPAAISGALLKAVRVGNGIRLSYRLPGPVEEPARIQVFDVRGRLVATLAPRGAAFPREAQEAIWNLRTADGRHVSRGSYFARLTAGKFVSTCKVRVGGTK